MNILANNPGRLELDARRIDDTNTLLYLENGAIDVFVQSQNGEGRMLGARKHVGRIEAGSLFPPLLHQHIATTHLPGTSVTELPADDYARLQEATAGAGGVERALSRFIEAIVENNQMPSRDYVALDLDRPEILSEGDSASTVNTLSWVRLKDGKVEWIGDTDGVLVPGEEFLPISARLWITAVENASLELSSTENLVASGRITQAANLHLEFALARVSRHAAADAELERARFKEHLELKSDALQNSLAELSSALGGEASVQSKSGNSLTEAMQILARHQGFEWKNTDRRPSGSDDPYEHARALARSNNIPCREVTLADGWWNSDSGHLLVMTAEEDRWLVLTVGSNGRGLLHDPKTGTTRRVTRKIADTLSARALSFFRPFPDRPVKPLDLLKFATTGLRSDLSAVLIISLITGALGLLLPVLNGIVFEKVVPSGERSQMWTISGVLIAAAVSTALLSLSRAVAILRVESKMNASVQGAVWNRVLKLPATFFRDYSAGDLADRVEAINVIRSVLSGTTIVAFLTTVFSTMNLALLFHYDVKLALVALAMSLLAIIVLALIGYQKLKYERLSAEEHGLLSGRMFEFLSGINKLRATASENRAFNVWANGFATLERHRFKAGVIGVFDNLFFALFQPISMGVIFALVGLAMFDPQTSGMTIGAYVAFNAAFGSFLSGMMEFANTGLSLVRLIPLYQRAKPIMETLPEDTGDKEVLEDPSGLIELGDVNFSYPGGQPVLKDVSLKIEPGSFIALVGPSGSGKSTLFRLLMGFEKPDTGTVNYDGRDLETLDLGELRRNIGIVLQSGKLLAGDIYTNIAGPEPLSMEEAWTAAEMVGLDSDIRNMPMGMHTMIGEGASLLSGGQRQRIMIARAIARRPRILFLDEATSALDNTTQEIVSRSLERLKATRVVIAHRLTTVMNADQIVVIDGGRIVQQGSFPELRQQDGMFKALTERQLV